jgi:hypothetical protein
LLFSRLLRGGHHSAECGMAKGKRLGGYTFAFLSLKACTASGIAKRPILLVLFFKEKYGISFE